MIEHNLAGRLPMQVGFERPLPEPQRVTLSDELFLKVLPGPHAGGIAEVAYGERLVWTARVEIAGAHGIRVLLADADLPEGTRVWTYGETGWARGPVGPRNLTERGIWTATVFAPAVYVEVAVPLEAILAGERAQFRIERVAEIFRLDEHGMPLTGPRLLPKTEHCFVDAMCRDSSDLGFIEDYRRAVANLIYE